MSKFFTFFQKINFKNQNEIKKHKWNCQIFKSIGSGPGGQKAQKTWNCISIVACRERSEEEKKIKIDRIQQEEFQSIPNKIKVKVILISFLSALFF